MGKAIQFMYVLIAFIMVFHVSCADKDYSFSGANPNNGAENQASSDLSCSIIQEDRKTLLTCPDGSFTEITNGNDGADGKDGSSCSVHPVEGGAVIQCDDGSTSLISHGIDGISPELVEYNIIEIINPCEDGLLDEVLIRFGSGEILAHYASGSQQFFTIIGPGTYVTTDGTNCHFRIHDDGTVEDL